MKKSELRAMSAEELVAKEQEMRREIFNLRFQSATGEIANPMRIRAVRRGIARLKTILTEKAAKG